MGKSQRTKGAAYEREIAHKLSDAIGVTVRRNIGQARDGGEDLPFGPFSVECKRRATLTTIEKWMAQAIASAQVRKRTPVIVARADHGTDYVILRLNDWLPSVREEVREYLESELVDVG